jgi:hypothetical protein
MQEPRIQHQVTDAGPPERKGVLNVVATLEQSPMILKAKLICGQDISAMLTRIAGAKTYCRQVCKFAFEGRSIPHFLQEHIVIAR